MGDEKELRRSSTQKNIEIKTDLKLDHVDAGRKSLPVPEPAQKKKKEKEKTSDNIKIETTKKVVPADQIKQLPVMGKVRPMTQEELAKLKTVYNDADKDVHLNELVRMLNLKEDEIPKERNDVILIRSRFYHKVTIVENGVEKEDYDYKPDVDAELKKHLDWLIEYFKVNDNSIELLDNQKDEKVELELKEYNVSVDGIAQHYEYQGKGTNNCYCCSASTMFNQYLTNENKKDSYVKYYSQQDIRNFRPSIKKYQNKFGFFADRKDYDNRIKEFEAFSGAGKTAVGNVFEVADVFVDNLEKTGSMLNKMVFTLPKIDSENKEKDDLKARNMKAVFLDKIAQVLKTGNVVNLLKTSGGGGHYTTITGIKGDQIEYLDSYHSDSYNVIQSDPIDTIFNRVYGTSNQIEIEFITKMKSPQEMTQEFTDLNYSEKDGYTLRQISEENVFNVGQTKGLAVKKNFNDLGRGMDGISHAVYFANPKQKVETERIENHEWLPEEDQTVKLPKKVAKSEFPKIVDYGRAAIVKDKGRAGGAKTDEEKKPTAKQIEEYNDFQNMLSQKQKVDERRRKKDEATKDLRQKLRTELSEDKKKGKEAIKEYEKKSGDYSSFGVSFDLRDVNINIGDSKYMRRVKSALKQYIDIRKEIFKKRKLRELTALEIAMDEDGKQKTDLIEARESDDYPLNTVGGMNLTEREDLGIAFDNLAAAIDEYTNHRSTVFQTKRRKERLAQVKKISDQLLKDDSRFRLSADMRKYSRSLDAKYSDANEIRKYLMPTWQKAASLRQLIGINNLIIKENKEMWRETGTTPDLGTRILKNLKMTGRNTVNRIFWTYNALGGLVDRTLGAGTMIAANSLELAGKVIKLPLKALSAAFNFGSKHIAKSDVRWRMDYSLTKGWKDIDDGRRIFRRYLKGAFVLPAAVTETLVRGIPYIFGKKLQGPVYERTTRWTKDILKDVGNVFGSLVSKKYANSQRAYEDTKMAGGVYIDENSKLQKTEGYSPDPESLTIEGVEDVENAEEVEQDAGPELAEEFKRIDELYKGSKIPAKDLKQIKEAAVARHRIQQLYASSLPKNICDEMEDRSKIMPDGVDRRGFAFLLRPVKLNAQGEPLTKEDQQNLELNIADYEGYKTGKMSERKRHLDYLANDILKDLFTLKQLNDPEYIRAHKEQAIRFAIRIHYFDDVMQEHPKYYLSQAEPKIRVLVYLLKGTFYIGYAEQKIIGALYGYGYGSRGITDSEQEYGLVHFTKGSDYKTIKKANEIITRHNLQEADAYGNEYRVMLTEGIDIFSKEGKERLEEEIDPTVNMVKANTLGPIKVNFYSSNNITVPEGGVHIDKLQSVGNQKFDEFLSKQNNESFINGYLREIDDFVKKNPFA